MFRGSGDEAVAAAVAAELRVGEERIALFPALTPSGSVGGLAPAELMPLVMAVEHLAWRQRSRAAARRSIFPLAPRMIIGLTDQRLLIWAARRRWRVGAFLGYVSRDRVVQARAPTVGQGWRTVLIYLANEPTVSLQVPAGTADRLCAALSGRAGESSLV